MQLLVRNSRLAFKQMRNFREPAQISREPAFFAIFTQY